MIAWYASFFLLIVVYAMAFLRQGPQFAVGAAIAVAWVFPIWAQLPVLEVPAGTIVGSGLDLRIAISALALVAYCFSKRATYLLSLTPCDMAMLGLLAVHLLSDWLNDGLGIKTGLHLYAEWWAPYVGGRVAFQFRHDIERLVPILAVVGMLLSLIAMLEATTGLNVFESLFGQRPPEQSPRELYRWGLRRAFGPCLNQIYLGVLLLLLLPWCLVMALRTLQRKAHVAWLAGPSLCLLGVVCTGSRACVACVFILMAIVLFLLVRRARVPMLVAGALLLVALGAYRERVINLLERWSGEQTVAARSSVVVNEEEQVQYSAVRNRFILFDLYRIALRRSGMLGFGTEAVTGFPVNVPLGPQEVTTLRKIRFIDNTYILLTLRFGYLGLLCFGAAGIAGVGQMLWIHRSYSLPQQLLGQFPQLVIVTVAGALAATMLALLTVWMPPDFGFVYVWLLGASSGLYLSHGRHQLDRTATAENRRPKPR